MQDERPQSLGYSFLSWQHYWCLACGRSSIVGSFLGQIGSLIRFFLPLTQILYNKNMKKIYTCPMHPEIKEPMQGSCPKCGMRLVLEGEKTDHSMSEKTTWKSYTPLVIVFTLIFITSLTISFSGDFSLKNLISYFMIGFFLVFAGFKFMDLKGFAEGYSTYDLLAKRWFGYGYIYPFIELFFGLGMILLPESRGLLIVEILVMSFSGVGVAIKILKKEKFQCACLGTFLKVPLTKITLIEDFGMAGLAFMMLLLK